jgi:tetratricopeptide (TPR) repeat protein
MRRFRIGLALVAAGLLYAAGADEREQAESELQAGIALTKRGQFQQALPHFLAARGRVAEDFALEFNLALCYVGTRQFPQAIQILTHIRDGRHVAEVDNLLAQAFVGDHQQEAAMQALRRAAAASPNNERLYLLVSEACLDEGLYDLGIRVLEVGLRNVTDSPRLIFERGLLRSQLEQAELADRDFQLVRKLSPDSEIAWIAAAQQALLSGNVQEAIRAARAGLSKGHTHYLLLTMLGEALLRAGATPATPAEFGEAQAALERAVAERPGYSSAHIALGRIYLAKQNVAGAISQLETARQLDPRNRSVYAALATAWQRARQPDKAREALAALAELNRQEAARIGSADGGHAGYAGGRAGPADAPPQ